MKALGEGAAAAEAVVPSFASGGNDSDEETKEEAKEDGQGFGTLGSIIASAAAAAADDLAAAAAAASGGNNFGVAGNTNGAGVDGDAEMAEFALGSAWGGVEEEHDEEEEEVVETEGDLDRPLVQANAMETLGTALVVLPPGDAEGAVQCVG